MQQLWLFPDVLRFPLLCCVRLTILLMFTWMGFSLRRGRTLGPYWCVRGGIPPWTSYRSNRAQQGWARSHLGFYSLLGQGWALSRSPGPFADFGKFTPAISLFKKNVKSLAKCRGINPRVFKAFTFVQNFRFILIEEPTFSVLPN